MLQLGLEISECGDRHAEANDVVFLFKRLSAAQEQVMRFIDAAEPQQRTVVPELGESEVARGRPASARQRCSLGVERECVLPAPECGCCSVAGAEDVLAERKRPDT